MTTGDAMDEIGSIDPTTDLMVDANAVAGLLERLFGGDMTAVPGQCAHCHTVSLVGAMHAYVRAPGTVIRCPACHEVVLRIVETSRTTYVDARGAAYIAFERTDTTG
jgi:phage FluMu protein Com